MKTYEKPVVLMNEDMAEGVFADSGDACYTTTAYIHQVPEPGREDYRIQVNGRHDADHTCEGQILKLSFNQAVNYVSSQGSLVSGSGTATIEIKYTYHNNPSDNIGLGDVVVTSEPGLAVTGASLSDDEWRH